MQERNGDSKIFCQKSNIYLEIILFHICALKKYLSYCHYDIKGDRNILLINSMSWNIFCAWVYVDFIT